MEHRWGHRISIDLPIWVSSGGIAGPGMLRNLSVSGALIETSLPLATLTMVRVQIPRSGELPHASAWGFIVRDGSNGFGIEWCDSPPLPFEHFNQRQSLNIMTGAP
jgi:hypothetical protein